MGDDAWIGSGVEGGLAALLQNALEPLDTLLAEPAVDQERLAQRGSDPPPAGVLDEAGQSVTSG
ncbi:hypothetical protein [Streptomyces sp. NPDC007856]|uniref:hypothetical protein n=1 Tax=Streptomyces sp. NPDC007856 TaxID=3364781 RepID=UPI0036C27368